MNRHAWRVLTDYLARTAGLWMLVTLVQIIQSVTFWATGVLRVPLLGVVLARVAYTALAEQPRGVLRTLPLTRRDGALIHWWGTFGLPALAVAFCMIWAAMLCAYKNWAVPSPAWLGTCVVTVIAVLAWLSALEKVLGYPGAAGSRGYVPLVWGALAIAALVGLPTGELSTPVLLLIAAGGMGLSGTASLLAGQRPAQPNAGDSRISRLPLKGWAVMLAEAGRTTVTIAAVALVATAVIHKAISPWAQTSLHGAVIWLLVSTIAVATCLSMRRWVETVRSLRILPISAHRLALALYLTMVMPGVLTCLLVSAAQRLSPDWGLDIPWYLLVVFLPAPLSLIRWQRPPEARPHNLPQQWAPAMSQAVWPAWAGALCTLPDLPFMPGPFLLYLTAIAALFSVAAYRALLAGIRSPDRFEPGGGTLEAV